MSSIVLILAMWSLEARGENIDQFPMPSVVESTPVESPTPALAARPENRNVSDDSKRSDLYFSTDLQYSTNGPVQQGYSVTRFLVGAKGDVSDGIEFDVALGAARETSSMQLPFLVPRRVWLGISDLGDGASSLRIGMFRPWVNPHWSSEPGVFNDYSLVHSSILPAEQLGMEGVYRGAAVNVGVGMTNGNGTQALNTNNARSFHFFFRNGPDPSLLKWSTGAYTFRQSAPGSANFKDAWVANASLDFEFPKISVRLGGDASWGQFLDTDTSFFIHAWSVYLFVPFLGNDLMIRAESLDRSPLLAGRHLKRVQLGPVFHVSRLTLFFMEEYTEPGVAAGELSTILKLRAEF